MRPFTKIDSQLLLFSTHGGRTYEGNAKYLFIYCSKYTNYHCVWISKDKLINEEILNSGLESAYYFSWTALLLSLKAFCVFITHSLSDVMPIFYNSRTIIINLWHGIPIKRISFLDKNLPMKARILDYWRDKRCDYFISNSDSFNQDYLNCFKIKLENIIVCGLPCIDFLKDPEHFIPNISNPFPNDKIIFLYAPTFRDYLFENPFYDKAFLEKIENHLEKVNGLLYIKHHPFDNEVPSLRNFKKINSFEKDIDINEILPFVNNLICDYSSLIYNFHIAYSKKDIFLFCPDFKKYEQKRGFLGPFKDLYINGTVPYKFEFRKIKKPSNIIQINKIYNSSISSCKSILDLINHNDK